MSFLDAVLGRSKPVKSTLDYLFGISTGELTLQTEFNLQGTNEAAISFRPVSTGEFTQLTIEINSLLKESTKDSPLTWKDTKDEYGYQWMVITAQEFSNLVATVHMVSRELEDSGFGDRLLASVFRFKDAGGRDIYWIYNYKRGAFYPLVPAGNQTRDNPTELRLCSLMSREMKVEDDMTKWYPLWGIPL